jgi:signal transduction histidine kinase/CheY-like chemotaxis protein
VIQLSAPNDLRRRLFLATAAIAAILLVMMALGIQALSSYREYSRFAGLFATAFEATAQLETQLGKALAQQTPPGGAAQIASEYRRALTVFTAMRATRQQGHARREPGWDALEAAYGIDPAAERARLGLGAGSMPASLHALWHGEDGGDAPLEETAAEFFTLIRPIVEANGAYTARHANLLEEARRLSKTQVYPAFSRALLVLAGDARQSLTAPLYLLIACAGALLVSALLCSLFIFRPLHRLITSGSSPSAQDLDPSRVSLRGRREFLAIVGHELRTAMNGIIGFSHLLLETELEGKQKEYAQLVHQSGQTLLALINDILDLSEIEAGALRLEDANFSLPDIVCEVVTQFGPQAAAKRLELAAYIDPALPEKLRGDGARIRQMLANLVSNAIKFTASGGVGIEVRHETGDDRTGHILSIAVSDTGAGIAKDELARIFEESSQAGSASGLGLTLCRELTRLMGGEISVESLVDKGSTFCVRLRLASAHPAAERIADAMPPSGFAGRRFLVVDDNAVSRLILRLQLQSYGAEVECVADAQAALATLAAGASRGAPYDLAIIDQTLPDNGALSLRNMIRNQPQYAGLKLLISSPGGIVFDQQARALGFDAACPKPILQDKLIGKILQLLEPLTAAPGAVDDKLPRKMAAPGQQPGQHKKTRVLVAEDNAVNQHLIASALKQAGILVDIVGDGVEAVHAVKRQPYDLVLMDIRMPVMNGVEATQRIRALPTPAGKLPIIAMTANAMAGDREEYLAAGMDDYVAKPIDFNILMAKIRAHLPGGVAEGVADTVEAVAWKQEKKSG